MEEWGLQAVVRGVTNDQFTTTSSNPDSTCFDPFLDFEKEFDQETGFAFPDIFGTSTSVDLSNELEEIYKPFCPTFSSTTLSPAMAPSLISSDGPIEMIKEEEEDGIMSPYFGAPFVSNSPTPALPRGAKHKTRKNQQKKVVIHATADVLSSDLWAWRKYGQKPIKGSPYPRSYYRCSSSKGCLARRQVEQSCTDAGMYIVTYTAEHSHPRPTRHNSLAGINRHKFGTLKTRRDIKVARPCNSPIGSPTISPMYSSVEEDLTSQPTKEERRERKDDDENAMGENDEKEFATRDIMLSDDFFAGLGNLDEIASDLSFSNQSTNRFPVSYCS